MICPKCGIECDTDYKSGSGNDTLFHIWCPMCEHTYEIQDIGLRPFGLEEEE